MIDAVREMMDPEHPPSSPDGLPLRLRLGRLRLRLYIAAVLLISATTITSIAIYAGPHRLPQGIVRFGFTCILMTCLWRGSPVARWLTVILLGTAGLAATLVRPSPGAPVVFIYLLKVLNSTYLPLALALVLPTSVRDFVAHQHRVRQRSIDAFRPVRGGPTVPTSSAS